LWRDRHQRPERHTDRAHLHQLTRSAPRRAASWTGVGGSPASMLSATFSSTRSTARPAQPSRAGAAWCCQGESGAGSRTPGPRQSVMSRLATVTSPPGDSPSTATCPNGTFTTRLARRPARPFDPPRHRRLPRRTSRPRRAPSTDPGFSTSSRCSSSGRIPASANIPSDITAAPSVNVTRRKPCSCSQVSFGLSPTTRSDVETHACG